jgi:nitrate reductase NapE component
MHGQATGKLYYLRLRVEGTPFCNLQSRARTHAVLVIGLYELLGNPTALSAGFGFIVKGWVKQGKTSSGVNYTVDTNLSYKHDKLCISTKKKKRNKHTLPTVLAVFIVEEATVTVTFRTTIKALFLFP